MTRADDNLTAEASDGQAENAAAEMTAEKNYESVELTIAEIKAESGKKSEKKHGAAYYIFFPFIWLWGKVVSFFRRIKFPLTVKTTLIFTLMFIAVSFAVNVYLILNVQQKLIDENVENYKSYINMLWLTSFLLIMISISIVAALGSIFSQMMLKPVRKMIVTIDKITGENLATRLDEVDAQDELKELTKQINEMLDDLEDAFERQKKFVSDASHELKTPISVIRGYAGLLSRWGKDDPEVLSESIESIAAEAENMQNIVEQLLFLARIGRYSSTPSHFNLTTEIDALVHSYSMIHPKRTFTYRGKKEVMVFTDKNMLIQCIRALTDNAVKYSEDGTDILFLLESDIEGGTVSVGVKDNGVGIAEEDLPFIFDRFYRCDRSRNRGKNSTGLGLTIAKSIADMLGGSLDASSVLGEGSTFTVTVPAGYAVLEDANL